MHRFSLTAALLVSVVLVAPAAFAQSAHPGDHFVENWDQDGDGAVTLEEATSKRDDIFSAFDADEDGKLSPEEYALFDEMRAKDQADMREKMAASGMGGGMGGGMGQGQGMGQGHGQGHGQGMGHGMGEEGGMQMAFNDADKDGQVSREEFVSRTPEWIAMMDRDGDGVVTVADFGRN